MIERLRDAAGVDVSRETIEKLERYVALLKEENARQNLVSAATLEQVWERHILDWRSSSDLSRGVEHHGSTSDRAPGFRESWSPLWSKDP